MVAGALGGLAGGYFSDLFGRKPIICGSLLAFILCFWLFMNVESLVSLLFLGLAGFMAVASHAVVVVMAHRTQATGCPPAVLESACWYLEFR